ncbi:hypothetical protein VSS37_02705 [Candidatus Thiothrix sp. Deng01]|uniref:Uncharacterized protein n=1 Tax=Candidatus Thiothrix phosphatis TaxID=3112415 RepID=A0ABU6CUQ8_9GAMM|nr:hypothetical protein [Candidatus Thiothrix sp. Deng01]MEB4589879.1 hypothetical protein [Candidatus Thiothrix sp. Deng01]
MAKGQRATNETKQKAIQDWSASGKTVTDFCKDYKYILSGGAGDAEDEEAKLGSQTLLSWLEADGYRLVKDNSSSENKEYEELKVKYNKLLNDKMNSIKKYEPEKYAEILSLVEEA